MPQGASKDKRFRAKAAMLRLAVLGRVPEDPQNL
jgi:hypothetical protein